MQIHHAEGELNQSLRNFAIAESFYSVTQIWIIKYSVKYSIVDCRYLLFLQDFFVRLKPKQYKNGNIIADCLKNHLATHKTKQII